MTAPVIRRYFDEDVFPIIKNDFDFLTKRIVSLGFEYDMQLRNNYFHLSYRGNNIAEVRYTKTKGLYTVQIHHKFVIEKTMEFDHRSVKSGKFLLFSVPRKKIRSFFKSEYLEAMGKKVKKVNYQEERTFEQMIMTDNVDRSDLIIIDRQITDTVDRTKMDMLALDRKKGHDYQFCVLEVKLGNNPELRGKVFHQLKLGVDKVKKYFDDYKACYEKNLKQKQALGLINEDLKVNIVKGVSGVVVVVGYSGIAKKSISLLKQKNRNIRVLQITNKIDLSKAI